MHHHGRIRMDTEKPMHFLALSRPSIQESLPEPMP